jgi:outer membrane protein assembly factor BamE (lipoprotein component of BamABCDE complex)
MMKANARRGAAGVWIVLLLAGCADDGTRYAPGFDEARFRELRPGASMSEVKRVLGEPLLQQTFADGETVFYYSRQRDARDNYRIRNVVFDGSGRMIRRVAEFYLD